MNIHEEKYIVEQMLLDDALEIVTWTYQFPYSLYNWSNNADDISELMDGTYYSVKDTHNQLIGYVCFGQNAQVREGKEAGLYEDTNTIDIGLGMKPQLTGQGRGKIFMQAAITYAWQSLTAKAIRLSVASFNTRAINLYKSLGFSPTGSFMKAYIDHEKEFIVMLLKKS